MGHMLCKMALLWLLQIRSLEEYIDKKDDSARIC